MGKFSDQLLGAEPTPDQPGRFSGALLDPPPADPGIVPQGGSAGSAGLGAIAGASFIDNPASRARYFASKRGIPADRYRLMGNDVIYQDEEGIWHKEVPDAGFTSIVTDPMAVAKRSAAAAGPAIPAMSGAAAGILTAPALLAGPLGMAGSVAATGGAAAAGEVAKDAIGSAITGESQMDWQSPAMQAATAGLGQGIGAGMTALGNRYAARDIDRLNRPAAQQLQAKAQAENIPLTAAEVTGLRSLKGQQTLLGNIPRSGEVFDDFYKQRGARIDQAVKRYLDGVSKQDSAEIAGEQIKGAAEGVKQSLKDARRAVAGPHYEAARASGVAVDPSDALAYIDGRLPEAKGAIKGSLEKVRDLLARSAPPAPKQSGPVDWVQSMRQSVGAKPAKVPESRLGALHEAKIEIDRMLAAGKVDPGSAEAFIKRDLTEVQQRLTKALTDASPDYAAGRAAFAAASKPLDEFEAGLLQNILKLPDGNARNAAVKLFSPTNAGPRAAFNARTLLEKQDPAAWQGIKRAYLEHVWQGSQPRALTDAAPDLAGAVWRRALLGDKKQAAILKTVMKPGEWDALNDLADVLEATGSVVRRNSHTAYQQEALRDLKSEATGIVGGAAKLAANPFATVREGVDRLMLGRHAEKLAEIATSPDAVKELKALRSLSPNSARFRAAGAQFLTRWGWSEGDDLLSVPGEPEPVPPPQPQ